MRLNKILNAASRLKFNASTDFQSNVNIISMCIFDFSIIDILVVIRALCATYFLLNRGGLFLNQTGTITQNQKELQSDLSISNLPAVLI